jgi:methanogenic corrinoid protein MtbC1
MSSIRHLVDTERWPVGQGTHGWNNPSAFSTAFKKSPWTAGRRRALQDLVGDEVIPRLLQAHTEHSAGASTSLADHTDRPSVTPEDSDVAEIVRLAIFERLGASLAHIAELRSRGAALETVFLDLLAPAARLLGEMWKRDVTDFVTVTLAMSRLQQMLRELGGGFRTQGRQRPHGMPALIVGLPGDQHTFGVSMLQELLRRDGWFVSSDIPTSGQDLIDLARSAPFRLIGLSVSRDVPLGELATLIEILRRSATSGRCRVSVGGRFFIEHPELVEQVGADATALDGRAAVHDFQACLTQNLSEADNPPYRDVWRGE